MKKCATFIILMMSWSSMMAASLAVCPSAPPVCVPTPVISSVSHDWSGSSSIHPSAFRPTTYTSASMASVGALWCSTSVSSHSGTSPLSWGIHPTGMTYGRRVYEVGAPLSAVASSPIRYAPPPVIGGGGGETDPENPQIIVPSPIGDAWPMLILLCVAYAVIVMHRKRRQE